MATNLTTVNIDKASQKELKKLSQSWGMSQVEFLNHAIWYFKKTGIKPNSPIFSPMEEIAKMNKRLDQVIKFIRHQQTEKLNPLLDEVIIVERRLKENLAVGLNREDLESLRNELAEVKKTGSFHVVQLDQTKKNLQKVIISFFEAFKNSEEINFQLKDQERLIDAILKI